MTWTTRILNSFSSYCDPVKQYWGLLVNDNITDEQTCSCYPDVLWVLHIKVRIKSCNSAKKKIPNKNKKQKTRKPKPKPFNFYFSSSSKFTCALWQYSFKTEEFFLPRLISLFIQKPKNTNHLLMKGYHFCIKEPDIIRV